MFEYCRRLTAANDENRFLLEISAVCQPLGDKQVDADLKEVTADLKRGKNMLKSRGKIVLKAIQYWDLCHNEKNENWFREFCDAEKAWLQRRVADQDQSFA